MKKIFTLLVVALATVAAQAQIQTIASFTVEQNSATAGENNTAVEGTGCSVQLHGNAIEQKDGTHYGLKLDSESKYVQIDFTEALEAGDAVYISYFMGSNGDQDDKNGVALSTVKPADENYAILATMYAQKADKKDVVTKSYTAVGGEKKFLVYKLSNSSSVYFHAVKVTRGKTAATDATTWNFTQLSASDENAIKTDATNWVAKEGDGTSGWANNTTLTTRNVYVSLKAGETELEITKGLQFTRDNNSGLDAGKIFIKKGVSINIAGSNCLVKIPGLAKDDVVRIQFFSNGDEARGFSFTNTDVASAQSTGKTDYKTVELKVAADGDITLKNDKSINIQAITVNATLPEIVVADGIATVKAIKANTAEYDLAGQKVAAGFKGLVIKDGKKFVNK